VGWPKLPDAVDQGGLPAAATRVCADGTVDPVVGGYSGGTAAAAAGQGLVPITSRVEGGVEIHGIQGLFTRNHGA